MPRKKLKEEFKKAKITISIDKKLLKEIDEYIEKNGGTRSGYIEKKLNENRK